MKTLYRVKDFETKTTPLIYESDDSEYTAQVVTDSKSTRFVLGTPKGVFEVTVPKETTEQVLAKSEEYRLSLEKALLNDNHIVKLTEERENSKVVTNWSLFVEYEDKRQEELLELPKQLCDQIVEFLKTSHGYKEN